jgi:hypothetical protein
VTAGAQDWFDRSKFALRLTPAEAYSKKWGYAGDVSTWGRVQIPATSPHSILSHFVKTVTFRAFLQPSVTVK